MWAQTKAEICYTIGSAAHHRDILNCCSRHGKFYDVKLTGRFKDSNVVVVIFLVVAAIEIARIDVKGWL